MGLSLVVLLLPGVRSMGHRAHATVFLSPLVVTVLCVAVIGGGAVTPNCSTGLALCRFVNAAFDNGASDCYPEATSAHSQIRKQPQSTHVESIRRSKHVRDPPAYARFRGGFDGEGAAVVSRFILKTFGVSGLGVVAVQPWQMQPAALDHVPPDQSTCISGIVPEALLCSGRPLSCFT